MRFIASAVLLACLIPASVSAAVQFAEIDKTPWGSSPQDVAKVLGAADAANLAHEDTLTRQLNITRGEKTYPTPVIYKFAGGALAAVTTVVQQADGKPLAKDEAALIYADMVRGVGEGRDKPKEVDTPCPREEQACKRTLWRNGQLGTVAVAIFDGTGAVPPSVFVQYRPRIYMSLLQGRDVVFAQAAQAKFADAMKGAAPLGKLTLTPADAPDGERTLTADYTLHKKAASLDQPKLEAKEAAVCILKALAEQGVDPGKDHVMVSVSVESREKGATGKDLVRLYGSWRYNWANDALEWEDAH